MLPTPSIPAQGPAAGELPEVPIDHLDYDYIEKCSNAKELRDILALLRSGKEGRWYDLEKACETKLISVLPPKEKRLYLAQITEPSHEEKSLAENDIMNFLSSIAEKDAALRKNTNDSTQNSAKTIFGNNDIEETQPKEEPQVGYPPVRGKVTKVKKAPKTEKFETLTDEQVKQLEQKRKQRISGYNWDAWEKYNVEEEEKRIDQEDELRKEQIKEHTAMEEAKHLRRVKKLEEELKKLGLGMDFVSSKSPAELEFLGNQEKQKGNECFKAGEFEESYLYFSRAIILNPGNPAYYSNRALSAMKLKRYEQAETDCSKALALDPENVKVIARRGVARHHRGKYVGAIQDFEKALELNPTSKELNKLLAESRKMHREVGGIDAPSKPIIQEEPQFTRLAISADDDESDSEDEDVESDSEQDEEQQVNEDQTFENDEGTKSEDSSIGMHASDNYEHTEVSKEASEGETEQHSMTWMELKEQGIQECKREDFEKAIDTFQLALEKVPSADLKSKCICLGNQAVCYNSLNNQNMVIELCTTILELDNTNIKALMRRSRSYELSKNYSEALTDMCAVLRIDPNHDFASDTISRLMGMLNNGIESEPTSQSASTPDQDVQVPPAEQAAQSTPRSQKEKKCKKQSLEELKAKGNESFKKGEYKTALGFYNQCLSKHPNDPKLVANRAMVHLKLRDFKAAIQDCHNGISLVEVEVDPGSSLYVSLMVKLLYRRSIAREDIGEEEAAYDDLLKAQSFEPQNKVVQKALVTLRSKLSKKNVKESSGGSEAKMHVKESNGSHEINTKQQETEKATVKLSNPGTGPSTQAEKAAQTLREQAKSLSKIPVNLREFDHLWKLIADDNSKRVQLLKQMKISDFRKVFKYEVTDDLISSIVSVMNSHMAAENPSKCLGIMSMFTESSCFKTAIMFLTKNSKNNIEKLFNSLIESQGADKVGTVRQKYI